MCIMAIWKTIKESYEITKKCVSDVNNGIARINDKLEQLNRKLDSTMPFRKARYSLKILHDRIDINLSYTPLNAECTRQYFKSSKNICNEIISLIDDIINSDNTSYIQSMHSDELFERIDKLNNQLEQEIYFHFSYDSLKKLGYIGEDNLTCIFRYICENKSLIQLYESINKTHQCNLIKELQFISSYIKNKPFVGKQ